MFPGTASFPSHSANPLILLAQTTVLEVSAGRKKDEVASVLERLSNCDGVEAVSMDMSTTFREAVQLCLPRARIVADHFHVIQHVNKAVRRVRPRRPPTLSRPDLRFRQLLHR